LFQQRMRLGGCHHEHKAFPAGRAGTKFVHSSQDLTSSKVVSLMDCSA
jgi:hypothetical protein